MPVHNADIAAAFGEIADLLEIGGENPFRIRAYRNASRLVGDARREFREAVAAGEDLTQLDGIGADLARKIAEFVTTGRLAALDELKAKFPPGLTDLLRVQGVGPKRVKTLWKELGVDSLPALAAAAQAGRIRTLAGFGEKMEQNILQALATHAADDRRFRRASVVNQVEALARHLQAVPGVRQLAQAGSFRRGRETVGDLDLLVEAGQAEPVMAAFVAFDEVRQVLAQGETKSSVILRNGLQVDLRVVPAASFGAALQYFTGSKAHNVALRGLAIRQGLKLNEYGLFRGEESVAGAAEADIYRALGLAWVPPELREDRGEVEAAAAGSLPALVEERDLRGDLHNHSTWSDGAASIREMAAAARARGYAYLAITDHSKRLTVANGLDERRLLEQLDEVDAVNAELRDLVLLKGIEVDILEDGQLDLSDEVLARLDVVVASVHSKFNLSREQQTERILRALDHPHVAILGHPTGRLLLERPGYELDMERIITHARQRGCFLELNAHPERLDLNDVHARMARDAGVLISINSDAHSPRDLALAAHGIVQARRAWLGPADVLNTRPLPELRRLLARAMGRSTPA